MTTQNRPLAHDQPRESKLPRLYQIVVQCRDEERQRQLYEQLKAEGYKLRVLTL